MTQMYADANRRDWRMEFNEIKHLVLKPNGIGARPACGRVAVWPVSCSMPAQHRLRLSTQLQRQAGKTPLNQALLTLQGHAIAQVFKPSSPTIGRIFRDLPGAAAVDDHTGPDTLKKDDAPHIYRDREVVQPHESCVKAGTGLKATRRRQVGQKYSKSTYQYCLI